MRFRCFPIFLLMFLGGMKVSTPLYGQPFLFEQHEIARFGDRMGQTALVDMDRDGDLDWVFGRLGRMYWYEFISADSWALHSLGQGASTDVGGCPLDVNRDGWMDVVVGDSWYEHPGLSGDTAFTLHRKNLLSCHDNVAVDIDGDGIQDIVALSNHPDNPVMAWYRIPRDYTANWNYTKIARGIHGGVAPRGFGDLDQDGDMDLIRGDEWAKNVDGKGKKWELQASFQPPGGHRPGKYGLALRSWCTDLDGDGDLDVVETEADTPDGRVFWWENQDSARNFVFHPISAAHTKQDFHSLALADMDGDGDLDVITGGGPLSEDSPKLLIWENQGGTPIQWKEHLILSGQEIHELVAADVDQDGDIDICSKPWVDSLHLFLENISSKKN